jgi:hypothetical protein
MGKPVRTIPIFATFVLCSLLGAPLLPAQTVTQQGSSDSLKELLQTVHELKVEVAVLNQRFGEVMAAEAKSEKENMQLREELAEAMQRIRLLDGSSASVTLGPSNPQAVRTQVSAGAEVSVGVGAAQHESIQDQLSRLEEKTELLDAKVADQYQTKVESGAKYRLRLSGIFLLNLYGNTGTVNNQIGMRRPVSSRDAIRSQC